MVAWIVAHHLWERPGDREAWRWAALDNGVTALTMSVAVPLSYAVLFALILVAAWIFVPGGYLQSTLRQQAGLPDYAIIAWLTASLAKAAGALGSSLEDEKATRRAAHGYRQRRRQENGDEAEDDPPAA